LSNGSQPFSRVTWDEVEKAFPRTLEGGHIESELEDMIKSGALSEARIDLVDKLLISPNDDRRISAIETSLSMAKQSEHALRLRLLKISMQSSGLVVKAPVQGSGAGMGMGGGGFGMMV